MNKTVGGKQCTIFWYVDNINILHMIPKVLDEVISQLTTKYGKVSPLTVSQGHVHNYLGMRSYYGTKGKVSINIYNHI